MSEPTLFDWVSAGANLGGLLVALGGIFWAVRQFSKEQTLAREFFERERAADRETLAEQAKATTMAKQQDEAARMLSAAMEALMLRRALGEAREALDRFFQHAWVVSEYWPRKSNERAMIHLLTMMVGEHVSAGKGEDHVRTSSLINVLREVLGPFVRGFTEVDRRALDARATLAGFASGDRLSGLKFDGSGYDKVAPVVDRIISAWLTPDDFYESETREMTERALAMETPEES